MLRRITSSISEQYSCCNVRVCLLTISSEATCWTDSSSSLNRDPDLQEGIMKLLSRLHFSSMRLGCLRPNIRTTVELWYGCRGLLNVANRCQLVTNCSRDCMKKLLEPSFEVCISNYGKVPDSRIACASLVKVWVIIYIRVLCNGEVDREVDRHCDHSISSQAYNE